MRLNKTRGGALLTALFIMTLVAIVATAMTTRLQFDIYRTRLLVTQNKMYLASQAVTFWALSELSVPKNTFARANSQGLVAQYPKGQGALVPNMQLSGGIYDLQSRFNMNNLTEKKFIPGFLFLLKELFPDLGSSEKFNLMRVLQAWIAPFNVERGKDALMEFYLSQNPPYFPANQLMQSASELRLLKDYSPLLVTTLEPYITVLPEPTPININSASPQVLITLGNGLKEQQVADILMSRGTEGIKNLKDLKELLNKLNVSNEQLTTESRYFMSLAKVHSEESTLTITSIIKRERDKKGNISLSILREYIQSI